MVEPTDQISLLRFAMLRTDESIRFATTKASFLGGFDAAALAGSHELGYPPPGLPWWGTALVLTAAAALVWSLLSSLVVIMPALREHSRRAPDAGSLLFYRSVVNMTDAEYTKALAHASPQSQAQDLMQQYRDLCKVADRKYRWFQSSVTALYVTVACGVVAAVGQLLR